jgi:hypothetical protein
MPKIKRLIKYVYTNSKHKGSRSRMYNLLRQSYNYTYRYLLLEFKLPHNDSGKFFIDAYKTMTLRDFDKVCSMMPRHSAPEVLGMITLPQDNYGGIQQILNRIKNAEKLNDWYKDKRTENVEMMLKNIIRADTFEKRQAAIEFAERKLTKLSYEL